MDDVKFHPAGTGIQRRFVSHIHRYLLRTYIPKLRRFTDVGTLVAKYRVVLQIVIKGSLHITRKRI